MRYVVCLKAKDIGHLQDDDEANILPEADVTMVTKSIAASWEVLQQDHAALLLPFLQNPGLHQTWI